MAFSVRIFCYSGVIAAKQTRVVQLSNDSVFLLKEPYIASQKLTSSGSTPVSSTPLPVGTRIIRVEVDDSEAIQFEVQFGSTQRIASLSSPSLSGRDLIFAGEGAVFSFVEAGASVPQGKLLLADGFSHLLQTDGVSEILLQ